ncbi:hypothetical protein [Microbaculum marinisediminis]|uniref:Uncharacterized protein n=1 Tax=Microbaculum marinisediminis TaxID=2931392 RepID=A0AAW5QRR8_9HYPH|nr:hypothetical protein [Microbaculum sp. A6E488]MCT8970562.1 hypothetical protein [Microbaculum sp. A6E488]
MADIAVYTTSPATAKACAANLGHHLEVPGVDEGGAPLTAAGVVVGVEIAGSGRFRVTVRID